MGLIREAVLLLALLTERVPALDTRLRHQHVSMRSIFAKLKLGHVHPQLSDLAGLAQKLEVVLMPQE